MARKGKVSRKTKETSISVEVNIDGKGQYKIDTGIGFLDHMLEQLSKHSLIDLKVKAKGDTHIDLHHTTEDTGIAIGEALKKAAKKSVGIKRYAHRVIPMDETLTRVAIDVSNRPYLIWKVKLKVEKLGEMDTELPFAPVLRTGPCSISTAWLARCVCQSDNGWALMKQRSTLPACGACACGT